MSEILVLGDVLKLPIEEVRFSVKYKAKIKADDVAGSGDGDAKTTIKGREVCDVDIEIDWPNTPEMNARMGPIVRRLNPRGPEGGKPLSFAHEKNGLDLGAENSVHEITIREASDESKDEDGIQARKYSAKSWSKDTKPGTGSTASGAAGDSNPFGAVTGPVDPSQLTAKTSPKPPTVKP